MVFLERRDQAKPFNLVLKPVWYCTKNCGFYASILSGNRTKIDTNKLEKITTSQTPPSRLALV
jgi:hypothetical protein